MSLKQPVPPQPENAEPGADKPDDHYLPPRKTVHPTEKERWIRYFYRSVLWIFVLLVTGLLAWGWKLVKA